MIFDWLFSLLKNKKNKEAIAPIFIHVPTREDLIKDGKTEELELLDQYKKEYKDKLNRKLLIGDISSENLSKLYLDNQNIIIKHIMDNTYRNVDEILASGNIKELLKTKIEYLGLYILSEENSKIYKEIELRYAALSEIKRKSYFIRPVQRRAISNEIDFLYSCLIICKSNDFASNTTCRLYLIRMNEINKYINNLSDEETTLLNDRKKLVMKLANTFIKDKYDSILSSNMQDLGIISYLEIELEKYYLSHQEDFELCKLEILPKPTISDKEDTKQLLKQIEELEAKYLLRNMFNKLNKNMFLKLYELKFILLTHKISCFGNSVISKEDYGYEFYKIIVSRKISKILEGYNQYFNKLFSNAEQCDSSKEIVKKMFFDIEGVLTSGFKLAILLSFDKTDGFLELLSSTMINKDTIEIMKETYDYNVGIILSDAFKEYKELYNFYFTDRNYEESYIFYFTDRNYEESYIKWDDTIPLKSILEGYNIESSNLLIEMYRKTNLFKKYPKLPEGIRELGIIHSPHRRNFVDRYIEHLDYLRYGDINYSDFVFPNSIKVLKLHNITGYAYVSAIPYGIKEIDIYDSYVPPIPPTVEKIEIKYSDSYDRKTLRGITIPFYDFKNSVFLRKKENIISLLRSLSLAGNFYIEFYEDNNVEKACSMEKVNPYESRNLKIISYYEGEFYYIINEEYGPGFFYEPKFYHYTRNIALDNIPDIIMLELSTTSHKQEMSQSLCKQK